MKLNTILTLLNTPKIGSRTVQFIIDKFYDHNAETDKDILDLIIEAKLLNKKISLVSENDISVGRKESDTIIESSQRFGIDVITYFDVDYPKRYKNIPNAPSILYAKGNKQALNTELAVAIIGTREPSDFGLKAGERLSELFALQNFTVVSGLAIGCDTVAHRGCLKANGITVALMAGGLDKIYPKTNQSLAEEILAKNGCLLSEYAVGVKPRTNHFVERDRLQSGLSQAVIVIETDVKGGTMHTVKFSQEQNRYLGCLWNHPQHLQNHPKIQGNKKLINDGVAMPLGNSGEVSAFMKFLSTNADILNLEERWRTMLSSNNVAIINPTDHVSNVISGNSENENKTIQFKLNF